MQKQKNTGISMLDYYDNLKGLIEQKHNLEQNNQQNSTDYSKINKHIQQLGNDLSTEDLKGVKTYCKQEYTNLVNSYNADMDPGVLKHISNKLTINDGCFDAIEKSLDLKKDAEYTR